MSEVLSLKLHLRSSNTLSFPDGTDELAVEAARFIKRGKLRNQIELIPFRFVSKKVRRKVSLIPPSLVLEEKVPEEAESPPAPLPSSVVDDGGRSFPPFPVNATFAGTDLITTESGVT